jgi:hypothetical protein
VIATALSLTKQRMANLVANNPEIQGAFDKGALEQLRALEDQVQFEKLGLRKLLDELNEGQEDETKAGNCDPDDVPETPDEPVTTAPAPREDGGHMRSVSMACSWGCYASPKHHPSWLARTAKPQ